MSRMNKNPFNPPTVPMTAVSACKPLPSLRVPQHFIEAMERISRSSDSVSKDQPQKEDLSAFAKWKSSFTPLGKKGNTSQDKGTNSERTELYDPSNPLSSDSEPETTPSNHHRRSAPNQDNKRSHQLSPDAGRPDQRPWESSRSEPGSRPPDRREFTTRPTESRGMFPPRRASPPRIKPDYPHQLGHVETGLDQNQPPMKVPRKEGKIIKIENCPITCDLCDVVLANAQELEEHLDSRGHWDTLEHIQQNNHYDDLVIAFLQEVMMYKSQHCSRAIEDSALQALQGNDHMTKVGLFHCAACRVYISTSAAEVQTHITSQEHLCNTKEFEVRQRHSCLSKAETMMKELKPQFEDFQKGGSPFERKY